MASSKHARLSRPSASTAGEPSSTKERCTADIVCDAAADLHIEVKRTERLNPYMFLDQAIRDATPHKRTPLVVCRSSYKPWLIVCRVSDLPKVAEQIIEGRRRGGVQAHSPGEAV